MKMVGTCGSDGFLALEWAELRNLNLKSQFSIFVSFRDIHVHTHDFLKFVGLKVGVSNLFGSVNRY